MAVKKTIIEEVDPATPKVVKTTQTVVNPTIHHPIVEDNSVVVDSDTPTVKQSTVIHEPLVKTEHPQKIYEKKKSIFRVNQAIWVILIVIEVLLIFRVILRVLGADPYSLFATLIYTWSYPFSAPFAGILRTDYGTGNSVFEWSTVIAGFVYFIIALLIMYIIGQLRPVTPEEVEKSV